MSWFVPAAIGALIAIMAEAVGLEGFGLRWWAFILSANALVVIIRNATP